WGAALPAIIGGGWKTAEAQLQAAAADSPGYLVTRHHILWLAGWMCAVQGRTDEAIGQWEQALAIVAGNIVTAECAYRADLARLRCEQGELDEARDHLQRARALLLPEE